MMKTRPENHTSNASQLTTHNHTQNNKARLAKLLPRRQKVGTQSHKTASQPKQDNSKNNPNSRTRRVNKQPTLDAEKKRVASGQQDLSGPEESVVEEKPHQCTLRPRDTRSKWRQTMAPSTVIGLLEQPE